MAVRTGLEVLLSQGAAPLRGRTIGVVCNQASTGPRFRHVVDLLAGQPMVRIGALFGPEHGVRGEAQDMETVERGGAAGSVDRRTGAPVYSLYGDAFDSLTPTPQMLRGLDALVIDIQDVGARYYTFIYTMVLCMKAAREAGMAVYVLDRPNPLGGDAIEGGPQDEGFLSFVGLFPLPVRHGMTAGEIARWADDRLGIDCELYVVAMDGWERRMLWEDTGLPFIPPSPNMPTPDTARVYPGMCLVEGTSMSEGRGTTRPFEQNGAPYLDPDALEARLNALRLPGVHFRACTFKPMFQKHGGRSCGGVFTHVTDRFAFKPYRAGLELVRAAQDLARNRFRWRTERYEFVDDIPAFDLLTGTDRVRRAFDRGEGLGTLLDEWAEQEQVFRRAREEFLLYE